MRPEETGSPLGGTLEQHNFKDVDGLGAEGQPLGFRGGAASGVQLSEGGAAAGEKRKDHLRHDREENEVQGTSTASQGISKPQARMEFGVEGSRRTSESKPRPER